MRKGIYKDEKRGTWFINTKVTIDGRIRTVTIRGYQSKGDANNDYERAVAAWVKEHSGHCKAIFFKDLIDEVKKSRSLDVKIQTARTDESIYSKYLSSFNSSLIKDVFNQDLLKTWYNRLVDDDTVSLHRKNKVITRFKDVLLYAYSHLYVDAPTYQICDVILKKIRSNNVDIKKEKDIWTREEYEQFIDAIPSDKIWYPLFILMGELGCRIGELQGLMWKHLDFEKKNIFICQQVIEGTGIGTWKIDTPKTSSSVRHNRLTDETLELLRDLKAIMHGEDNNFIFGHDRPISRNAIRRALYKYAGIAGVKKVTPHALRHSNASWLVETVETMEDVKVISNRLGHSSTQMTLDTYSHVLNSRETTMINILGSRKKALSVKEKNEIQ